ncbi:M6 family metalloprotease domain-containing protein [Prevotella histicola]|uniref:M6 family metalloprotease domain-containing protein n=1 Tax=Prevotella histicola TaxID=470565 RepID=UPI001CB4209A|nr:M6 family metalloprotease domain-containing protein [Prevotella histicola]MBF1399184.1 M6 family metalloprotease domain-containing protein [Prevotella histicola]MBF1416031.1 M6 family metalloprotease domain-containing protein [Prevotella histicola]
MKRIILLICFIACTTITTWAAKAQSIPVLVKQADGTTITVILQGDEHINWYIALDGTLLVQGSDNNYYVGRVANNGHLMATKQLAHEPAFRLQTERSLIQKQDKERFYSYVRSVAAQSENAYKESPMTRISIGASSDGVAYFPHTGSPKALVILAEFADTLFTIQNTKQVFTNYLMNEGHFTETSYGQNMSYKGVRGYFKDCSYGLFTPAFDVVGPVKLPKPQTYYGVGNDNITDLMTDACNAVDNEVDFSQYDANGDGMVDLVYIIYAGHSANYRGNASTDIWPKSGTTILSKTFDGKSIRRYGVSNELAGRENKKKEKETINGIGLFCHEFSHTLGLPDIYAYKTDAEDQNDQGMELWDLMDGGTEVQGGRVPSPYLAWEREAMGWMSIDTLTTDCHIANLKTIDNSGKAYKILNPLASNEYIVLQSIQKGGWYQGWGNGSYPKGLLVYRVSYASNKVNVFDFPNNVKGKPRVIVVPADGEIIAAAHAGTMNNYLLQHNNDLYPYNGIDSIKGFKMFNESTLEKSIFNITETDGVDINNRYVSFDFRDRITTGIQSAAIKETNVSDNRIYTLDGRFVGTDKDILPRGIYIQDRKKFVK